VAGRHLLRHVPGVLDGLNGPWPACGSARPPSRPTCSWGWATHSGLCTRGCLSAVDSEHHLLFECLAKEGCAFTDVLQQNDADLPWIWFSSRMT
jgi:hypothetical protein